MKLLKYGLFLPLIGISFIPAYQGEEIIGGRDVTPHSKPHMASIQWFKRGKYQHYCGGALISHNWVLTAAHCEKSRKNIKAKQPLRVVLGAHSLSQDEESQQSLSVLNQVPYPQFNWKTKQNDIMLLKLESNVKINKYVKVLELPKTEITDVKPGTPCSVAGWGKTSTCSENTSDTLREVKLKVIDRKTCNSKDYYNHKPEVTQDMICVGDSKGKGDSCQGDSGGPLICNEKYTGIVSFGKKCADPKKPGVYTLLTKKYLDWINKTIGVRAYNMTAEELY